MQKTERVVGIIDGGGIKGEGLAMGHPTGDTRLKRSPKIAPHVEIAGARSAAQPLHRSARREIDTQFTHVDGYCPSGLINVGDYHGANLVSSLRDSAKILDVGALEDYVRY